MFELEENINIGANIKVVGVGGGGSNAVSTMIEGNMAGVQFIVANTDIQALTANKAANKIQLGKDLTKGLGAGANPDVGRRAAIESYNEIVEKLEGADMVFVTAGMGGGTGTGGAPIVAKIARELGALTIGVVTRPFVFEGKRRTKHAEMGLQELKENVDSLIVIPNQKLLTIAGDRMSLIDTFRRADEVLLQAVKGISDLINVRGLVNRDFADVRTVMQAKGLALMGTGMARGDSRAIEAATQAISSPLLDNIKIDGATGIIINVTGGPDLTLFEVNEASQLITEAAHEDADILFGAVIDPNMSEEIRITVIATGFADPDKKIASVDTVRVQDFLNSAPSASMNVSAPVPQIELPPIPSFQQPQQQAPLMTQYAAPVAPAYQAPPLAPTPNVAMNAYHSVPAIEMPEALTPKAAYQPAASVPPAYMPDNSVSARDKLIAKAKAFKDAQEIRQKHEQPEQLSMNVEANEQEALEKARQMAREVLSSPFANQNLEVPAFIRKRQSLENQDR